MSSQIVRRRNKLKLELQRSSGHTLYRYPMGEGRSEGECFSNPKLFLHKCQVKLREWIQMHSQLVQNARLAQSPGFSSRA